MPVRTSVFHRITAPRSRLLRHQQHIAGDAVRGDARLPTAPPVRPDILDIASTSTWHDV
jgi:hypothetical protein